MLTRKEVREIKAIYTSGTRIELVKMFDDPQPLPIGLKGTVNYVDDIGTIHMLWENGRTTGLVPGYDEFRIIKEK